MFVLYNFLIGLYPVLVKIIAFLGHKKAFQWTDGRRFTFTKLNHFATKNKGAIWFHCASLGEFEQARPLIEMIKQKHPNEKILLTFFSPSGFEIRKNYSHVDEVLYLPNDSLINAVKFVSVLQPKLAIFVKYEFWINYIQELNRQGFPVVLISAIFTRKDIFFKWYGKIFRNLLGSYERIFVQGKNSYELVLPFNKNVTIAKDTRIDRVENIPKTLNKDLSIIQNFKGNNRLIVGGSTYTKENQFLNQFMKHASDNIKLIIAPPEVNDVRIKNTLKIFNKQNCVLYSESKDKDLSKYNVLIVDNIGLLSSIYSESDVAIIGGGFNHGIHNTLEPMTFGLPILFGPKYNKFKEAVDTVISGGTFTFRNYKDFKLKLDQLLDDEEKYKKAGEINTKYIQENLGGTDVIYNDLKNYFS